MSRNSQALAKRYGPHLAVVVGLGAFFAIISPYGAVTYLDFLPRWLYWITTVGCAWGISALTFDYMAQDRPPWFCVVVSSLLSTPAVFLIIYCVQLWIGYPVVSAFIPQLVLSIWVICFVLAWLFVPFRQRQSVAALDAANEERAPLSAQLPFEYRDSSIFALEADDHYVHVYTDAGKHLHYIRLRDAIALMTGIPGVRVHRSWWVATAAIQDVKRDNNRWQVVVKGAGSVPVSRSGLGELKKAQLVS